jgi:hypothetical protein
MRLTQILCLAFTLSLAACAAREVLQPRSGIAPQGADFSGRWHLRKDSATDRGQLKDAINKAAGGNAEIIPLPPQNRRSNGSRAIPPSRTARDGLVQVFLQSGDRLKITQTPHGIFISFDRSVVEEFRFGENRTVSVGQIEAQRVSGWDGDRYVVETLDRKGMKLTEELYLSDDRQTLHRLIVFRKADDTEVTMRQAFSRVTDTP